MSAALCAYHTPAACRQAARPILAHYRVQHCKPAPHAKKHSKLLSHLSVCTAIRGIGIVSWHTLFNTFRECGPAFTLRIRQRVPELVAITDLHEPRELLHEQIVHRWVHVRWKRGDSEKRRGQQTVLFRRTVSALFQMRLQGRNKKVVSGPKRMARASVILGTLCVVCNVLRSVTPPAKISSLCMNTKAFRIDEVS